MACLPYHIKKSQVEPRPGPALLQARSGLQMAEFRGLGRNNTSLLASLLAFLCLEMCANFDTRGHRTGAPLRMTSKVAKNCGHVADVGEQRVFRT